MCTSCLNSSKESYNSDFCIQDHNLLKLACKKFSKISDTKGGNQYFKIGVGKKRGEPKFLQNTGGNQSLTHYAICNAMPTYSSQCLAGLRVFSKNNFLLVIIQQKVGLLQITGKFKERIELRSIFEFEL